MPVLRRALQGGLPRHLGPPSIAAPQGAPSPTKDRPLLQTVRRQVPTTGARVLPHRRRTPPKETVRTGQPRPRTRQARLTRVDARRSSALPPLRDVEQTRNLTRPPAADPHELPTPPHEGPLIGAVAAVVTALAVIITPLKTGWLIVKDRIGLLLLHSPSGEVVQVTGGATCTRPEAGRAPL